jgi:hypothetical protein
MDADAVAGWESSATIRIVRATPECHFCSFSDHILQLSEGGPGVTRDSPSGECVMFAGDSLRAFFR